MVSIPQRSAFWTCGSIRRNETQERHSTHLQTIGSIVGRGVCPVLDPSPAVLTPALEFLSIRFRADSTQIASVLVVQRRVVGHPSPFDLFGQFVVTLLNLRGVDLPFLGMAPNDSLTVWMVSKCPDFLVHLGVFAYQMLITERHRIDPPHPRQLEFTVVTVY